MSTPRLRVPWTQDQVDALNRHQATGPFHPYTCPNRNDGRHQDRGVDLGALVATPSGWICSDCTYRQDWAHAFSVTL